MEAIGGSLRKLYHLGLFGILNQALHADVSFRSSGASNWGGEDGTGVAV
jgi:hypothetical protein